MLGEYRRAFTDYRSVIDELDQSLGKILGTIQAGLRDYNQSIENNFNEIVKISNPMISEAANFLPDADRRALGSIGRTGIGNQ